MTFAVWCATCGVPTTWNRANSLITGSLLLLAPVGADAPATAHVNLACPGLTVDEHCFAPPGFDEPERLWIGDRRATHTAQHH
jgi:hypothetical protein